MCPKSGGTILAPLVSSCLLREHCLNDARHAGPFGLLRFETPVPGGGNGVEPRTAVVLGPVPARANEPLLFESLQTWIKSPHVQLDRPARYLLDARGDGVAVHWPERRERPEDHQVKCALKHAGPCFI